MNTKICTKCNIEKSLNEFYKSKERHKLGCLNICKSCVINRTARYQINNKESVNKKNREFEKKKKIENLDNYRKRKRSYMLKHHYGITMDEWIDLLERSDYKCSICKKSDKEVVLCLDHDHSTNHIRGVLCRNCNLGIGNFFDNIDYLNAAVKYLTESQLKKAVKPIKG